MFGRRIEDDMVLKVAEFLRRSINSARSGARGPDGRAPHIEIEGKLGIILNKDTRSRLQLPVQSETVITTTPNCRFESDMTMDQHAHFNNILNSLVRPGGKTIYKHKYEMDHYHQQGGNKLRVTVDTKTNQVKEVMVKKRIADLEVHLPNSPLDFRISVNLEIPAQPPPKGDLADYKRYKDRLSYTHEAFAVDLTQVKEFDAYDRPKGDPKHELEIEFLRMPELLQEKNKWENKQQHRFYEYVEYKAQSAGGTRKEYVEQLLEGGEDNDAVEDFLYVATEDKSRVSFVVFGTAAKAVRSSW
ncbi:mRNA-capping enzyme subunit beta [Borealophlyctis nickersoniae]|nr:mRNA-capping enzyme subunit beta [Borealophlyctis nickersoniae]